jgi:hypothetical protein
VQVLHQGKATVTRPDGGRVAADVSVWCDDGAPHSAWGGRALVAEPDSLVAAIGGTCTLRWQIAGAVHMVGAFVLEAVQVGDGVETYRMRGTSALSVMADAD